MAKVKIECLSDFSDCETCGSSYSQGGRIWINGDLVWEVIPVADCFSSDHYGLEEILIIALEKLGFEFEEV